MVNMWSIYDLTYHDIFGIRNAIFHAISGNHYEHSENVVN